MIIFTIIVINTNKTTVIFLTRKTDSISLNHELCNMPVGRPKCVKILESSQTLSFTFPRIKTVSFVSLYNFLSYNLQNFNSVQCSGPI
jgi:hypothetical protein